MIQELSQYKADRLIRINQIELLLNQIIDGEGVLRLQKLKLENKMTMGLNIILSLVIVVITGVVGYGQSSSGYFFDAARFAKRFNYGSARINALGGAQVALGADFTSGTMNPAGLGLINRNLFSGSLNLSSIRSNSNYTQGGDNSLTKDSKMNFNLGSIGIVISGVDEGNNFVGKVAGGTFGFSIVRVNDFHRNMSFSGRNRGGSFRNSIVQNMNGINEVDLTNAIDDYGYVDLETIAYETYIANNSSANTYYAFDQNSSVIQNGKVLESGAEYEYNLSYGFNVDDVFYGGFGLGIHSIKYSENIIFREINAEKSTQGEGFERLTYEENYATRGTGFDFKAGAIYKIAPWIRAGVSVQLPTRYSIKEEYTMKMTANYNNANYAGNVVDGEYWAESPVLQFDYVLKTPSRYNFGVALFSGKKGFIMADLELVNYGKAKLKNTYYNEFDFSGVFDADNQMIRQNMATVVNKRIGVELRGGILRCRFGIGHFGDPFKNLDGVNRSLLNYTAGLGICKKGISLDFSIAYSTNKAAFLPYRSEINEGLSINNTDNRLMCNFTTGLSF